MRLSAPMVDERRNRKSPNHQRKCPFTDGQIGRRDSVLGLEDFMTIQALVKRGVYLCDIAEQLGIHPRTVRRALRRGGAPPRRGGRRGSLLDPYRPVVDQLLGEG